jgi:hypothetical protein
MFSLLSLIRNSSGNGSTLGLDFQTARNSIDLVDSRIENEKVKFGIIDGQILNYFSDRGLSLLEDFSAADIEASFLRLNDGSIFGKIASIMHLAKLRVAAR